MSHTFTQVTLHAVFATRGRRQMLKGDVAPRLHAYLAEVINAEFGPARQVGGAAEHVHLLFDLTPTVALADCLRHLKSVSSGWVHRTFPRLSDFAWQEGYGAFSVSASLIPRVKRYILTQQEHHRARPFEEEFVLLLEKHGVRYDPRDLWKEPAWHGDGDA
jgi:REP element-mobilizing transposase RayT